MTYTGKVERKIVSDGSKNHEAVALVISENEYYKLRRSGGNPFSDSVLEGLVGLEIVCEGVIHANQIFIDSWSLKE
jgi:hypothetical protein